MDKTKSVSLVIPVHNESECLEELLLRIDQIAAASCYRFHFIFVNDGSTDRTLEILKNKKIHNNRIGIINLSRCFGKEYAVSAGLKHANSDAVILLDADLQDPPEYITSMLSAWESGFDVVAMKRIDRKADNLFKKFTAGMFYRVMNLLCDVNLPRDVGDYRLMSKRVVNTINSLPESNRCMKGIFAWVGFKTKVLNYRRDARYAGSTKWSTFRLLKLAIDGVTAFSIMPLRVATAIGITIAFFSFILGCFFVFKTILQGDEVQGFTTLLTVITFLGGTQLIAIGVLGEYVGRMFIEVKRRPLFIEESIDIPMLSGTSAKIKNQMTR